MYRKIICEDIIMTEMKLPANYSMIESEELPLINGGRYAAKNFFYTVGHMVEKMELNYSGWKMKYYRKRHGNIVAFQGDWRSIYYTNANGGIHLGIYTYSDGYTYDNRPRVGAWITSIGRLLFLFS